MNTKLQMRSPVSSHLPYTYTCYTVFMKELCVMNNRVNRTRSILFTCKPVCSHVGVKPFWLALCRVFFFSSSVTMIERHSAQPSAHTHYMSVCLSLPPPYLVPSRVECLRLWAGVFVVSARLCVCVCVCVFSEGLISVMAMKQPPFAHLLSSHFNTDGRRMGLNQGESVNQRRDAMCYWPLIESEREREREREMGRMLPRGY